MIISYTEISRIPSPWRSDRGLARVVCGEAVDRPHTDIGRHNDWLVPLHRARLVRGLRRARAASARSEFSCHHALAAAGPRLLIALFRARDLRPSVLGR